MPAIDSMMPSIEEATRLQENFSLWRLLGLQKPPGDGTTTVARPTKAMMSTVFVAFRVFRASRRRRNLQAQKLAKKKGAKVLYHHLALPRL